MLLALALLVALVALIIVLVHHKNTHTSQGVLSARRHCSLPLYSFELLLIEIYICLCYSLRLNRLLKSTRYIVYYCIVDVKERLRGSSPEKELQMMGFLELEPPYVLLITRLTQFVKPQTFVYTVYSLHVLVLYITSVHERLISCPPSLLVPVPPLPASCCSCSSQDQSQGTRSSKDRLQHLGYDYPDALDNCT